MKVLVIGGAGFIGSHLVSELRKLHDVRVLDNGSHVVYPALYTYGDVRYSEDLELMISECDTVVHLAAQINVDKSLQHPRETLDTNVLGTQNVLETALKFDKKVVFASSSEIYGCSQEPFMDEEHPTKPLSPYGVSKLAADKLCQTYHDVYGLKVNIVRNFNTFWEYQASDMYGAVISIFANRLLHNERPIVFGTGEQERDYMHVSDAVQAYMLAIEKDFKGKPINFGTGKTVTVNKICELLQKELDKKEIIPIKRDARPGEVMRLCAYIERAKELGFKPKISFEEGIKRYVEWLNGKRNRL